VTIAADHINEGDWLYKGNAEDLAQEDKNNHVKHQIEFLVEKLQDLKRLL
jgi:hypothetical protein